MLAISSSCVWGTIELMELLCHHSLVSPPTSPRCIPKLVKSWLLGQMFLTFHHFVCRQHSFVLGNIRVCEHPSLLYDLSMERILSLPIQQLIDAADRVVVFATNHKGLTPEDFEAAMICAYELIHTLERHDAIKKWAA